MSAVLEPASTRIRTMYSTDIDAVMEVESGSYDFPWTPAIFEDCLRVGYECSVLEVDGLVVGFAIFSMAAAEGHLLNLCVHNERRGDGLGSRLLSHVLITASRAGCRDIFLEVRPSNQAALRLYERFGFRSIGTRPKYYRATQGREDAYVLTTSLDPGSRNSVYVSLPADAHQYRH